MLVCPWCGSENVEIKAWVDANTNEFIGEATVDEEDTWCRDCKKHTGLIIEEKEEEAL